MLAIQQEHRNLSKKYYCSDIHRTENGYYDCFEVYDQENGIEYQVIEDMHGDLLFYQGAKQIFKIDC